MNSFCSVKSLIDYISKESLKIVIWGAGFLGRNWAYSFLRDKLGIEPHYYCDNDPQTWGSHINNLEVLPPKALIEIKNDCFVFVIVAENNFLAISDQCKKVGVKNIIGYTELLNLDGVKELYFPFMDDRIAVYTCVVGDYDVIKNHIYVSPNCDYYVISDRNQKNGGIYKYLNINDYIPNQSLDPTRQNRYCKINAHKIFPQYKYSIYFDANTIFTNDFSFIFNKLPVTRLAVAKRLFTNSLFGEALRVIFNKREQEEVIIKQMEKYWLQGMPDYYGQYWNFVLAREHNNPICKRLMEEWWEEVLIYSRRDQLSLPYVIWKNGFKFDDVGIIEDNTYVSGEDDKYWIHALTHNNGCLRV